MVLHGTGGSAASMLTPAFAGELFGEGQPLDAKKHFIILPDAIGAGRSSKPSNGLRTKFPRYNYDDMVEAQVRLLKDGLGIKHLRFVIGNSMGGMHTWIMAGKYPGYMDAAMPMASQPTAMASRNWMLRRMMLETIRSDPEYNNGNYTAQPRVLKIANTFYSIATNGGTLNYQAVAPTFDKADSFVDKALAAPMTADANDFVYQWGFLARLRRLGQSRQDHRRLGRGERRRRRTQSAGNRHHGARDQAGEERQAAADTGERRHARPRHHRSGQILQAGDRGIAQDRAAEGDVINPAAR